MAEHDDARINEPLHVCGLYPHTFLYHLVLCSVRTFTSAANQFRHWCPSPLYYMLGWSTNILLAQDMEVLDTVEVVRLLGIRLRGLHRGWVHGSFW